MAQKMQLNRKEFTDRLLGCWMGKNIGGTMGAPFEGSREMNQITGYTTPKGEPLANDDLDLQLVWLEAMREVGPKNMTANVLADYWMSMITPHWNEYGIAKNNLERGLLPPLSGEVQNIWKHSNGAWIRSEIWACMAPGIPNIAVKYAIMDASVDHGFGEGTYAEMFTAAMESMAFFENDIRTLIETALEYIPADCRVAKSVRMVLDGYDNKLSRQELRAQLVKDSEDLGWFQAPANVAYVVLGLMYGEGDFKKSMLYTIHCGDDTDCSGATCGAILGIILGASRLPEDWKEYIGDKIITMCINGSYKFMMASSCTELAERLLSLTPRVLEAHQIEMEYTDEESTLGTVNPKEILGGYAKEMLSHSPLSFEIQGLHTDALVEYESAPFVRPGSTFRLRVTLKNKRRNSGYYECSVSLPEGWSADYEQSCYVHQYYPSVHNGSGVWGMTVHVGETVETINRIPVMISLRTQVMPIMLPIVLLG